MANVTPELSRMIDNIEKFKKLISEKIIDYARKSNLLTLVDEMEETLTLSPASTRIEYHGAFPGGLVDHALKVVKTMAALNKAYEANLNIESLVLTGLFYDIGKCGDGTKRYYIPKTSDWHRKLGIMYEVNPEILNTTVSFRSLFLLQNYGVKLTEEEHYAISTIKDRVRITDSENLPITNEPMLAVVLQQAIRTASLRGANKTTVTS